MRDAPQVPAFPITGYAVCSALGATTAETVAGLAAGASALRPPTRELPFATVCGELPRLDALPPSLARFESPVARTVMRLHDELAPAIDGALRRWGSERVAVVLGTSVGGLAVTEAALAHEAAHGALPEGYDVYNQHGLYAVAELVCARAGIRGPRYAVSTACSSGAKVFASAQRLILAGVVDAVVVGGVDSLCEMTLRGFHALSVLSAKPCRPFGAGREGMNLGEGGALFVVAREGDGPVRLLGVGESSDAHHMSSPHPEGAGAKAAMRDALSQAGMHPSAVDHINAHGTGTAKNDAVEARVIADLFGTEVPVVSTKGATGHTLGAAGAIEAAFAAVAVEQGWIPPSLGADPRDPEVTVNVNTARRAMRCRAVLSNSFGFGGSNASLLLGAG